jgi:hypothetical protein
MTTTTTTPNYPAKLIQDSDFKLSPREQKYILQNSIERVINSSMELVHHCKYCTKAEEHLHELSQINWGDWVELKELTVKLWNYHRDEIFKQQLRTEQEAKNGQNPTRS